MMKNAVVSIIGVCLFFAPSAQAQKNDLMKVRKYCRKQRADRCLKSIRKLEKKYPEYLDIHLFKAFIYYDKIKDYSKCAESYKKALALEERYDIYYKLAVSYFEMAEYEKAKKEFENYLKKAKNKKVAQEKADEWIRYCNNGIKLKGKKMDYQPKNLGKKINFKYAQYNPYISLDGKENSYIPPQENTREYFKKIFM